MKKKNIIIGAGSAILAAVAGVAAYKNKEKIKNKVNKLKKKTKKSK